MDRETTLRRRKFRDSIYDEQNDFHWMKGWLRKDILCRIREIGLYTIASRLTADPTLFSQYQMNMSRSRLRRPVGRNAFALLCTCCVIFLLMQVQFPPEPVARIEEEAVEEDEEEEEEEVEEEEVAAAGDDAAEPGESDADGADEPNDSSDEMETDEPAQTTESLEANKGDVEQDAPVVDASAMQGGQEAMHLPSLEAGREVQQVTACSPTTTTGLTTCKLMNQQAQDGEGMDASEEGPQSVETEPAFVSAEASVGGMHEGQAEDEEDDVEMSDSVETVNGLPPHDGAVPAAQAVQAEDVVPIEPNATGVVQSMKQPYYRNTKCVEQLDLVTGQVLAATPTCDRI